MLGTGFSVIDRTARFGNVIDDDAHNDDDDHGPEDDDSDGPKNRFGFLLDFFSQRKVTSPLAEVRERPPSPLISDRGATNDVGFLVFKVGVPPPSVADALLVVVARAVDQYQSFPGPRPGFRLGDRTSA